jgi:hypothetical protein
MPKLPGEPDQAHPGAADSTHEGMAETLTIVRPGVLTSARLGCAGLRARSRPGSETLLPCLSLGNRR